MSLSPFAAIRNTREIIKGTQNIKIWDNGLIYWPLTEIYLEKIRKNILFDPLENKTPESIFNNFYSNN